MLYVVLYGNKHIVDVLSILLRDVYASKRNANYDYNFMDLDIMYDITKQHCIAH